MENEVKELFNERILLDGANKFGVNIEDLSFIGGSKKSIGGEKLCLLYLNMVLRRESIPAGW